MSETIVTIDGELLSLQTAKDNLAEGQKVVKHAAKLYLRGLEGSATETKTFKFLDHCEEISHEFGFIGGGLAAFRGLVLPYWTIDLKGSRVFSTNIGYLTDMYYSKVHKYIVAVDREEERAGIEGE